MNRIGSFTDDILSIIKKIRSKKIIAIIMIISILAIPTLLATGYVLYYEFAKPQEYFSVSLYDNKSTLLASESQTFEDASKSSLTEIFYLLVSNEKQIEVTPDNFTDRTFVTVSINHNGVNRELTCYFSTDHQKAYYIDSQKKCYAISDKLNSKFLSTPFGELFYPAASAHKLTTADHDVIIPKSVSWSYKGVDGKYIAATGNKTTDQLLTYEITSAIDIAFDEQPSNTVTHIYSNNKLIYHGNADDLSSLSLDGDDKIRVYIEAQWDDSDEADSYGKLVYEFYVHIKNRSSFYISDTQVHKGGFITLDCSNVTDIQKLSVESSREGFTPVFKTYGNLWRAVIPFSESDTEEILELTVSYGVSSESFSVSVLPSAPKEAYTYKSSLFDGEDTPTINSDKIRQLIFSTPLPQNPYVYFRGNFLTPESNGYVAAYTHNSTVVWGDELQYSYTAIGNEYVLDDQAVSGGSVCAIQGGVVAYIGQNDLLGVFAVIDHGCGVRSWYAGLGKTDVEVGDILVAGQHIGKTSKSAIDGSEGFRLFCTAYDVMIDPDTLRTDN